MPAATRICSYCSGIVRAKVATCKHCGQKEGEREGRLQEFARLHAARVADWTRPEARVSAVQVSAIRDRHCCSFCASQDGLIYMVDEIPNLPSRHCTSPRGCRCLIVPITKSQWKRLNLGDPRVTDDILGWVPEGGPKTLEEALGRTWPEFEV